MDVTVRYSYTISVGLFYCSKAIRLLFGQPTYGNVRFTYVLTCSSFGNCFVWLGLQEKEVGPSHALGVVCG
jgi:hypothetical protein